MCIGSWFIKFIHKANYNCGKFNHKNNISLQLQKLYIEISLKVSFGLKWSRFIHLCAIFSLWSVSSMKMHHPFIIFCCWCLFDILFHPHSQISISKSHLFLPFEWLLCLLDYFLFLLNLFPFHPTLFLSLLLSHHIFPSPSLCGFWGKRGGRFCRFLWWKEQMVQVSSTTSSIYKRGGRGVQTSVDSFSNFKGTSYFGFEIFMWTKKPRGKLMIKGHDRNMWEPLGKVVVGITKHHGSLEWGFLFCNPKYN